MPVREARDQPWVHVAVSFRARRSRKGGFSTQAPPRPEHALTSGRGMAGRKDGQCHVSSSCPARGASPPLATQPPLSLPLGPHGAAAGHSIPGTMMGP